VAVNAPKGTGFSGHARDMTMITKPVASAIAAAGRKAIRSAGGSAGPVADERVQITLAPRYIGTMRANCPKVGQRPGGIRDGGWRHSDGGGAVAPRFIPASMIGSVSLHSRKSISGLRRGVSWHTSLDTFTDARLVLYCGP
jgi:hypothetical protein